MPLQFRLQGLLDDGLGDPIRDGRHPQAADSTVRLGDFHALDRWGHPAPGRQSVPESVEVVFQVLGKLGQRLRIHAGPSLVGFDAFVGFPHLTFGDGKWLVRIQRSPPIAGCFIVSGRIGQPLRSSPITGPSSLLRVAPPLYPASVLSRLGGFPLRFSLGIGVTGSHVPHKSLDRSLAAFMPDAAWAVDRLPPDLSRGNDSPRFRRRSYAFDTSSAVHLRSTPRSLPDRVSPGLFPTRSRPRLLSAAAVGGLQPPPVRRLRGASPHLLCSMAARRACALRCAFVAHNHPQSAPGTPCLDRTSRSASRTRDPAHSAGRCC